MELSGEPCRENSIEPVLAQLGFQFDPFAYREASSDPHLGEYIVGHDTFAAIAWNDAPAFIFAPAGGGKTAMRIYTTRACWVALGGSHPFPIVFTPANHAEWPTSATVLQQLASDGAVALLLGLAFRPERLLDLSPSDQQDIAALLDAALPGSLDYYLNILRQTGDPRSLSPLLDRTYILPSPSNSQYLIQLCQALSLSHPVRSIPLRPDEYFDRLIWHLQETLHFGSVFILIDGVDALPETSADPSRVVDWLRPLLAYGPDWARRRIYLKGFLSEETQTPLMHFLGDLWPMVRYARLEWTPALLAELIRRRIYSATHGKFGSLDAFSSSGLRDVETTLVKLVPPLPREVIVLVQRVLAEYARRVRQLDKPAADQLQQSDLDTALAWYKKHPVGTNHPHNYSE